MAILTSSLNEAVLAQVLDCTSSQAMWTTLLDLFSARSSAQIVHTRLQLASLKKGAETVTEFYNRAKGLSQSLAAAGQVISDLEFTTYLLAGLDSGYDSVVTSLSTQPVLPSPTQILSAMDPMFPFKTKELAPSKHKTDSQTKQVLLQGPDKDGIYEFSTAQSPTSPSPQVHSTSLSSSALWHLRLGHPSDRVASLCLPPSSKKWLV